MVEVVLSIAAVAVAFVWPVFYAAYRLRPRSSPHRFAKASGL